MTQPLLELSAVSKRFGLLRAVDGVSLAIRAGEITAIIGENGAGKTTLMRLAAGALRPDAGKIRIEGREVDLRSPNDAAAFGVEMVHQHFAIVPELTIAENLALSSADLPLIHSHGTLMRAAVRAVERSGLRVPPLDRKLSALSVGERATVELVKALSRGPRLLILDEPTSVLSPPEVTELATRLRELAEQGTAIVFVTHKLSEVFDISERVYVMRGGHMVLDRATAGSEPAELARAMTGEGIDLEEQPEPHVATAASPLLEVRALSLLSGDRKLLDGIGLSVGPGEIVAIVGVAGNGQSELAQVLRGIIPTSIGEIRLQGHALSQRDLACSAAIGYIPADRTRDGIIPQMSIAENLSLGHRTWNRKSGERQALMDIQRYSIVCRGPRQLAGSLSGGNQQKVILARELEKHPKALIAAEPTRGLDLRATRFVHDRLREVAASGAALILLTSDLDEALSLSDALHVMYRGRLGPRLTPRVDRGTIGLQMAGFS
jgi:ABC-type uncharacterized transport system ATPase subunit